MKTEQKIKEETIEQVWKMLGDFRKYDPHNILADTNVLRGRLEEIAGEDFQLPR